MDPMTEQADMTEASRMNGGAGRTGRTAGAGRAGRTGRGLVAGTLWGGALTIVLLLAGAGQLFAQGGGAQSLRPYWHVFIAYAAVWLILMGWVVSISRRLARIERTTGE